MHYFYLCCAKKHAVRLTAFRVSIFAGGGCHIIPALMLEGVFVKWVFYCPPVPVGMFLSWLKGSICLSR